MQCFVCPCLALVPYSESYCVLPDKSEICWRGESTVAGGQSVTELHIAAEKKAVHLRRLLYVVVRVDTNSDPVSLNSLEEVCVGFLLRCKHGGSITALPLREIERHLPLPTGLFKSYWSSSAVRAAAYRGRGKV